MEQATTGHFPDYYKWVNSRSIRSLGTNDGAPTLAFQQWHHFKEAFTPELIEKAVRQSRREILHCIDPFGGSGTTALACQMMGISSTTIEVNPFLADAIKARLARYDVDEVVNTLVNVRRRSRKAEDPHEYFARLPETFVEPGVDGRWLFDRPTAARLASIMSAVDAIEDDSIRRLFRTIIGGMLTEVSNAIVSGKGRRYREKWQSTPVDGGRVDRLFAARAESVVLDIQAFSRRPLATADVICRDARKVDLERNIDLAVFSPPYPNSFDYTDVYNVELWMLGYLKNTNDNRDLRNATLTSHVQLVREYPRAPEGSRTLEIVLEQLNEVKEVLWSKWIPQMIGGYFADLIAVLRKVMSNLQDHAECWIVVGDSRYGGVTVPVPQILRELSLQEGWEITRCDPVRHMRSSVQQGWRQDLAESLIVFRSAPSEN